MKKRIAAIDIGTTKVCTIMGVMDSTSGLRVLGVGVAPARGIEKALITDTAEAKESIRESIHMAEAMAGHKLESAFIGLTGRHICSLNSKANIAITRKDLVVRADDMKRALDVALNMKVQPEQKILHVIPRVYKLDGMEVKNPIGMNGYEIEVEVHIITATMAPVQNLIDCVRGLGVKIEDLVLEPLASAEAVLGEEEKQAGVLIADIGGGTTDVAVIKDGSICHTSVLPAAGRQITADLIVGLGLTGEIAEEIKKRYGTLVTGEDVDLDETVGDNGKNVPLVDLCDIMHARVEEIIRLIILDLPNEDTRLIPAGIVLTGGCANIPGIAELAEKITKLPVRIGMPIALEGVSANTLGNPAYATSIGLLLWGVKNQGTATWNKRSKGWRGAFAGLFHLFR